MSTGGYAEAFVVGGEYNTSPPAPTSGQKVPIQVDAAGNVLVNVAVGGGSPNVDVTQWGNAAVSAATNAAGDGTQVAPTVRSTVRRFGQVLTTTPLGANATYTSPWFDTNQTGDIYVSVSVKPDQNGANPALFIDTTDDTSDNALQQTGITNAQTFAGSQTFIPFTLIVQRFWRVRYVNGATPQGTFKLAVEAAPAVPLQTTTSATAFDSVQAVVVQSNINQTNDGDGNNNLILVYRGVKGGSAFGNVTEIVHSHLYNGSTWDRPRTPTIFKTIAAVAVTAGTPVAVWTPTSGKKFRLMGYALSLSVAGSVILKDATTEMIRTPLLAAGIGQSSPEMGNGILSATANNALNADVSATGSISGFVYGTEE